MIQTLLIIKLGFLFIIYIVLHMIIEYKAKTIEKHINDKPGNFEREATHKKLKLLSKWFPAIYVVIVLIVLYMV